MIDVIVNTVGWAGAVAVLTAYGLVSLGYINPRGVVFQLLNLAGGVGLCVLSVYYRAWPSVAVNAIWVVIGISSLTWAWLQLLRARRREGARED